MVTKDLRGIFLFIFINVVSGVFASRDDMPDLFIKIDSSAQDIYTQQACIITVTLYSSTPDLEYAHKSGDLILKKGEFGSVQLVENSRRVYKKIINGKKYFCYPLSINVVTFEKKGSYEIIQSPYEIGVNFPVIYNDPFWGSIRSSEIKKYEIPVKGLNIKVRNLPQAPSGTSFSGAVGNFEIETIIPKGDIYINEEATAYIVIKGTGILPENILPEYKNAFTQGLQIKSITESRSEAFLNDSLVSELKLECIFIPKEIENVQIKEIPFIFFNPVSGKYEIVKSHPVKVNVKSSISKREQISI